MNTDGTTPRPWSEFAESGDWWIQQCDAEGNPIGETVVSNANDMTAADMLFIVRACNSFDALVEALRGLCKAVQHEQAAVDTYEATRGTEDWERAGLDLEEAGIATARCLAAARAALTKAGGL